MRLWLKNTAGVPDSMLTFALGGFIITSLSILASLVDSVTVGGNTIAIGQPDAGIVTAFLGATLLAYVSRRNKKLEAETELEKIKLQKE